MDFKKTQDDIKKYIEANYKTFLPEEYSEPDAYIDDVPLDLDKYKKNVQLFYDFSTYNFATLSNASNDETIKFTVYFTVRNGTPLVLKEMILAYTSSFYNFIQDCKGFGGLVDEVNADTVNFFYDVEGTSSIKASSIEMSLKTEV